MDPLVTQARTKAQQLGQQAVDFSARGNTLADELRKAVGERYADSPFATDAAQARSDFLSAGPQARSEVADMVTSGTILSPSQQAAILASKKAQALVPLTGSNLIQEAVFGSMEDLIGAGTNAWRAQSDRLSGLAGLAQTDYGNLLNEMMQNAQLEQQKREEERAAELFPLQKALLAAQAAAAGRGSVADQDEAKLKQVRADAQNMNYSKFVQKYVGDYDSETLGAIWQTTNGIFDEAKTPAELSRIGTTQGVQGAGSAFGTLVNPIDSLKALFNRFF